MIFNRIIHNYFCDKPKIYIDTSIKDLNAFVAEHFTDSEYDSICIAFADDLIQSELYFVMDGAKGMFVIIDESSSIPETIFLDEPRSINFKHFEEEYDSYLARFKMYCYTYRFQENQDTYRKEINHEYQ